MKTWIKAARLRTLPLALSCVVIAAFIAANEGKFSPIIFAFAVLTTVLLQVLANFANDYGDAMNGADNEDRIGPDRMVQTGAISLDKMRTIIKITIVLTLISGIVLLYFSFGSAILSKEFIGLFVLGLLSIIAALKYTAGRNPYGYRALGDLSVFLFFGLLGVMGNYFLYTQVINYEVLLPAISIGVFSMAVLNLNNMRDRPTDALVGKNTIPVLLGQNKAKVYHIALLAIGMICAIMYSIRATEGMIKFIYIIPFFVFVIHAIKVIKTQESKFFDPELKKVALSTFVFSLLFGIGLII